jgi:hypothetical protein
MIWPVWESPSDSAYSGHALSQYSDVRCGILRAESGSWLCRSDLDYRASEAAFSAFQVFGQLLEGCSTGKADTIRGSCYEWPSLVCARLVLLARLSYRCSSNILGLNMLNARHDRECQEEMQRGCPLGNHRECRGFRRKNRPFARPNPSYRAGARVGERFPRSSKINYFD